MVMLMMVEGNQKVKVVCNGKQTILLMLFLLMSDYLQVPVDEANVNHGFELVDEKDVKKMCFICTISFPMQASLRDSGSGTIRKDQIHQGNVFLVSKSSCQNLEA